MCWRNPRWRRAAGAVGAIACGPVRGPPESLAVLRQRDFRLVFGAFAVSVLGDRMVSIALAFAVLELGGSPTEVGLVLACRTLPLIGSLLIGGVVADRLSRRTVMVAADLARLATQGTLGLLLIAGEPPIWALAVLSGVTGVGDRLLQPGVDRPAAGGRRARAAAAGQRAAGDRDVGRGDRRARAGRRADRPAGPGWALAIDGATFGVSAAFLARLAPAAEPPARPDHVPARSARRLG